MKAIKSAMIMATILLLNVQSFASDSLARSYFYDAKVKLENMLNGQAPLSYEDAIYYIENAWWEDRIDYKAYKKVLDHHTANIKSIIEANRDQSRMNPKRDCLQSKGEKIALYEKALSNYAIYQYMTQTSAFLWSNDTFIHSPYEYSYTDPMGTNDWGYTHITNLLNSGKGNCFSMASLFRIFSERLGSDANLTTAPGHIYIRHADDKGTRYNLELANGMFPGSGTIGTVTYTPTEAIRSGIALRELDQSQSVALCLVYLAKGYEYKFGIKEDDFMLSCAEFALKYDSLNLNAMLLKAEVMETKLLEQEKDVRELSTQEDFQKYQDWITHIFSLGYREMPFEMKNLIIQGWSKDTLALLATTNYTPNRLNHPTLKKTRYASLSWGLFDEDIRTKPLERYGNTVFDTKKKAIVSFLPDDILYHHYNFDPVVFAWNIDPMAHKLPYASPYAFCLNNPILYNDPDGAYPVVTITKQKQGTTQLRVIGYTGSRKTQYTNVDLYKVTVMDTEDKNFKMDFLVTRDAFAVKRGDSKNGVMKMTNVAFEPKDGNINHYTAKPMPNGYPAGYGTKALKLTQYGSEVMHAEANDGAVDLGYRNDADVAAGIMMHVGGVYLHPDGSTSLAASEGCFGVTDGNSSETNPSNDYSNDAIGSIINQANKSKTNKGKIEVIIQKRSSSERETTKSQKLR